MKWITEVMEENKNREHQEALARLKDMPVKRTRSNIGNYKIGINMKEINGFPRRSQLQHFTKEEKAIWDVNQMIENMPHAHPLLTECQILLDQAKDKLSDWVDMTQNGETNG